MHVVIAAEISDVPKITNLFSNFTRLKGTFPKIKTCYDLVNDMKYEYDDTIKSGGEKKDYPKNVLPYIRELAKENDIVIIPNDHKLIKALKKYDKIKRLVIYEEDITSVYDSKSLIDMQWEEIYGKN